MTEDEMKILQKNAEQGDADAQFLLGFWYFGGVDGVKDYAKAFEWFLKATEQGEKHAQTYMGLLYFNGLGVSENKEKACEWFLKAAEHGDPRAQFYMGLLSEDKAKAVEWYSKAAEWGDADAQFELGLLYIVYVKDLTKGLELIKKAAAQGQKGAKDFLAKLNGNAG